MNIKLVKRFTGLIPLLIIGLAFFNQLQAQFILDAESGIVFTGLNHVRIPGDSGTFISF